MAALIVVTAALAAAQPPGSAGERFEFHEDHMATRFRIVVYVADAGAAKDAAAAAFARIAELNRIMSDYLQDSELMRLGRMAHAAATPVSPDLWTVLVRSEEISRLTEGAFDITAGPIVRLWRRARRTREVPTPERIADARALVDYRFIKLDPATHSVRLKKPGMQLDLGGIAKGYAAEAAQTVLRQRGIVRALVAAGGDIVVADPPPNAEGWRIGITPLGSESDSSPTLSLRNHGISTSGDTEQYVEIGGKRYSHIVDPRTGEALTERTQVSVIAVDGTTSDALATGLSVLGVEKGLAVVERMPGVSAWFVSKKNDARIERRSKGFPDFIPASLQR